MIFIKEHNVNRCLKEVSLVKHKYLIKIGQDNRFKKYGGSYIYELMEKYGLYKLYLSKEDYGTGYGKYKSTYNYLNVIGNDESIKNLLNEIDYCLNFNK